MEKKDEFVFNPELELERKEIAELAAIYSQPGFKVLTKIHRTSVDWFVKNLLNTDGVKKDEVLIRHNQAQVAAQLYTLLLNYVNNLVHEYVHSQPTNKLVESAEGLDIGDVYGEEDNVL